MTDIMQTRECSYCKEEKDITDFYAKKGGKNGNMPHCKKCHNKESRAWQKKNPITNAKNRRNYTLRTKYGLTPESYKLLLESQNNCCKVCNKELVPGFLTHVDHNHLTKKVRGILCNSCNVAIGFLRESPIIAKNIIRYLESNN